MAKQLDKDLYDFCWQSQAGYRHGLVCPDLTALFQMITKCARNYYKYPASMKPNLNSKDLVRFPKGLRVKPEMYSNVFQ